jgi:hypothetical protein
MHALFDLSLNDSFSRHLPVVAEPNITRVQVLHFFDGLAFVVRVYVVNLARKKNKFVKNNSGAHWEWKGTTCKRQSRTRKERTIESMLRVHQRIHITMAAHYQAHSQTHKGNTFSQKTSTRPCTFTRPVSEIVA